MRRPVVGMLVATCLLSVSGTGALSSSGLTNEGDGQRIALPEAGISVTFPSGWRIEPPSSEPPSPFVALLMANDLSAGNTGCRVNLWKGATSPSVAHEDSFAGMRANEQYEELDYVEVALPAGDGLHVVWRFGAVVGPVHDYYLPTPTGVARVGCHGAAPPLDAWLGIAESVEALPAGETQAWTFEPRIEMPAHGFAIDFPTDWTVMGIDRAAVGSGVLRALQSLGATDRTELGECWIEDHTHAAGAAGPRTIDDWLDERVEALAWMGEPVVTRVDLPSGPAGYLDWVGERDTQTKWLFIEDGRRLLLACHAEQPPDDDWLSIAETFEFLPAEE